jgi:RNA 3'-terminal phosphate cyclase (ATP)
VSDLVTIDGSVGEGGGQIIRSALALSLVTGRPFRIERIRARRKKPGLLRQHLTAVHAAATVGGARVSGAELGSSSIGFEPAEVKGGDYRWNIGTAGSTTLVLQSVLPALLCAREPSRLTIEGGTHNPQAPPFEFLSKAFLPLLRRMGASVELTLEAHGFYPAGGGRFSATIQPSALRPVALLDGGAQHVRARALVASLPQNIAERELAVVRERLGIDRAACRIETVESAGPGNVLIIEIDSGSAIDIVAGFGARGVSAETVAAGACDEVQAQLAAGVPVGVHLADQLLLPMALAGGGAFRTLEPTMHTRTNADVIRYFMDVPIGFDREHDGVYRVRVGSALQGSQQ